MKSKIRYPRCAFLIRACLDRVAVEYNWSKTRLYVEYSEQLDVSIDLIRAWQRGTTRPRELKQMERIARDGFFVAGLDVNWVSEFLSQVDAPKSLVDQLMVEMSSSENFTYSRYTEIDRRINVFPKPFSLPFQNNQIATAITVYEPQQLQTAIEAIGLQCETPVLQLIGGAAGMSYAEEQRLRPVFEEIIAPICQELQIAVVDGGTDAGIMRLMGQSRTKIEGTFPLVGVAAIGTVNLPQLNPLLPISPHATSLESNHTHFILIPGSQWSEESPWLVHVTHQLAQRKPSLSLLINGGEVSWSDIWHSAVAGQPVLALDGSGRTADIFSAALRQQVLRPLAYKFAEMGIAKSIGITDAYQLRTELFFYLQEGVWKDERNRSKQD